MERLVKGDVVVLPFPFSDLNASKKRPALVMAVLEGNDCMLAQITSQEREDVYSIPLFESDFLSGKLNSVSNIRPNKLFTADAGIILYKAGCVREKKRNEVAAKIIEIIS